MDSNPSSIMPPAHPDRVHVGESSGTEGSLGELAGESSGTHIRPSELLMPSDGAIAVGRAEGASGHGGSPQFLSNFQNPFHGIISHCLGAGVLTVRSSQQHLIK